jgi:hypothetical protein
MGFSGLQRFYVGKIGTGILWFFTLGLFGIGQLIDFIMILSGNFRDIHGRRLLVWESETPSYGAYGTAKTANAVSPSPAVASAGEQTPAQQTYNPPKQPTTVIIKDPSAEGSIFYGTCAFFGYILLLLGMLVLFLGAFHIPQIVLKIPDIGIDQDMQAFWGTPNWATFMEQFFVVIGYGILFLSLIIIIFARRRHGVTHILRAVIGIGFLVAAVFVCNEINRGNYAAVPAERNTVPNLPGNFGASPVGILIERLSQTVFQGDMITVVFFLIAAVVFLAWPPKKIPPRIVTLNPDGSNQIFTTEL